MRVRVIQRGWTARRRQLHREGIASAAAEPKKALAQVIDLVAFAADMAPHK
jgi:hypothetical protein